MSSKRSRQFLNRSAKENDSWRNFHQSAAAEVRYSRLETGQMSRRARVRRNRQTSRAASSAQQTSSNSRSRSSEIRSVVDAVGEELLSSSEGEDIPWRSDQNSGPVQLPTSQSGPNRRSEPAQGWFHPRQLRSARTLATRTSTSIPSGILQPEVAFVTDLSAAQPSETSQLDPVHLKATSVLPTMDATGHDRNTTEDLPGANFDRRGKDTTQLACNDQGMRFSSLGGGTSPSEKASISSGKLHVDDGGSFIPLLGSNSHSAGSVQDIGGLTIGNAERLCTRDATTGEISISSDTLGRCKVMIPRTQALPVKPYPPETLHQLAPTAEGSGRLTFTADECLVKVSEYIRLHAKAVTQDNQAQIKSLEEAVKNFQAALDEVAAQRDHFKQRVESLEAMGNQGRRIER